MIRVFLADDHSVVRDGLRKNINEQDDMRVVGEAADGLEVLALAKAGEWDVLLLDLSLPGCPGIEVVEKLHVSLPTLPIVVLSMYPESQHGPHLMRLGAVAYLSKARTTDEILAAIRKASKGGQYVTQEVATKLFGGSQSPHERLSPRELEILRRFCRGTSPTDIAEGLHLSSSTVSTYLMRVREKLGVDSNAGIVQYAAREHLFD